MAAPVVHEMAKVGFGTGTNELYDRARPSYPSGALSLIRKSVADKPSVNIAELGSGTGIFTRALLAHPDWQSSVAELRGVEPSEGMRNTFARSFADKPDVRVTVQDGTFDTTGLPDGWADLVIVAQAFHWCPDHEAAIKEFSRILKPNGVVILIWNLEDRDGAGWVAELRDVYELYEQGTPQFRLGLWRKVFDVPLYAQLFHPHEETIFSYTLPATLDIVADRVCSKSYVAVQPEDEKQKVRQTVKNILDTGHDKVWIDEKEGIFEYPYKTYVVAMRRK